MTSTNFEHTKHNKAKNNQLCLRFQEICLDHSKIGNTTKQKNNTNNNTKNNDDNDYNNNDNND